MFFKGLKSKLIILAILYIIIGIFNFASPIIEARLITSITDNLVVAVVVIAIGFLIIKTLSEWLWYIVYLFWQKRIKRNILNNIRTYIVDNMLELQLSNYDKYTTGFFQERIKNDPNDIARVANASQGYIINILTNISVIIYIFTINIVLGLIYVEGLILATIIDTYKQKVIKEKNKKLKLSEEKVNSKLSETVRGIRDIKLLNLKETTRNSLIGDLEENNLIGIDKDSYMIKSGKILRMTLFLTVFTVILVGIYYVNQNMITPANLIVLYLYNNHVFALTQNVSSLKNSYKEYELAIERIFDLTDNEKHKKDEFGKIHIDDFKGNIEFKNVSFGYVKNKKVLNNLNMKIKANETVAIVGSSGSGKTTIFNLISYAYKTDEGEVKLDNVNINDLDEKTIRNNVSIITQNPYIFNLSIKDNLKLVKPKATNKELEEVCKKASIHDYIISLPDKYDTLLGEGGIKLSGGQKQRLAIARALLKDNKILLFDEATSALDNVTQKEIQDSIEQISKDYTIIIVAHRLSTIINCDKIFFLENGEIVDSGTHEELLQKNKNYKKLYKTELL